MINYVAAAMIVYLAGVRAHSGTQASDPLGNRLNRYALAARNCTTSASEPFFRAVQRRDRDVATKDVRN